MLDELWMNFDICTPCATLFPVQYKVVGPRGDDSVTPTQENPPFWLQAFWLRLPTTPFCSNVAEGLRQNHTTVFAPSRPHLCYPAFDLLTWVAPLPVHFCQCERMLAWRCGTLLGWTKPGCCASPFRCIPATELLGEHFCMINTFSLLCIMFLQGCCRHSAWREPRRKVLRHTHVSMTRWYVRFLLAFPCTPLPPRTTFSSNVSPCTTMLDGAPGVNSSPSLSSGGHFAYSWITILKNCPYGSMSEAAWNCL